MNENKEEKKHKRKNVDAIFDKSYVQKHIFILFLFIFSGYFLKITYWSKVDINSKSLCSLFCENLKITKANNNKYIYIFNKKKEREEETLCKKN